MVTRRCTQRQFLLRPDKATNNAVIYCLAVAAQRFNIDVLGFVQMSNHLHEIIYDRDGNAPAFYEHFHKLLAKCMNVLRSRSENFFASEQVCVVRLENYAAVLDKLTYVATNPVKDNLVARVSEWPGANGYCALVAGKPLRAKRPAGYFVEDGRMPDEVTLELIVPPEIGETTALVAALVERVRAMENKMTEERARTGRRPLGAHRVREQSWLDVPPTRAPRSGIRPTVATRSKWALQEALNRNKKFDSAYRLARISFAKGTPIPFPAGTYLLRRLLNVPVAPLQNS